MKRCHPGGNCSLETLGRGCPAPGFVSAFMCPFSTRSATAVTRLERRELYFRVRQELGFLLEALDSSYSCDLWGALCGVGQQEGKLGWRSASGSFCPLPAPH